MTLNPDYTSPNPRWEWMREQDKLNIPDGESFWLWDTDSMADFILKDLQKDWKPYYGIGLQADWLALRFKFFKEPVRSFIKEYYETGIRHYGYEIIPQKPLLKEMKIGNSYIISIYDDYLCQYEPENCNISDNTRWGFELSGITIFDSKVSDSLKYKTIAEDGDSIRDMTEEEKYEVDNPKCVRILSACFETEEWKRLMALPPTKEVNRQLDNILLNWMKTYEKEIWG